MSVPLCASNVPYSFKLLALEFPGIPALSNLADSVRFLCPKIVCMNVFGFLGCLRVASIHTPYVFVREVVCSEQRPCQNFELKNCLCCLESASISLGLYKQRLRIIVRNTLGISGLAKVNLADAPDGSLSSLHMRRGFITASVHIVILSQQTAPFPSTFFIFSTFQLTNVPWNAARWPSWGVRLFSPPVCLECESE